jgi:polysaccharide biosynthesis protein PslG
VALALAALLCPATPALARVHAPQGFFGAVVDQPSALRDDQLALMQRSGVQAIRVVFNWDTTQPRPGAFDWSASDSAVRVAATHRISVLPIVIYSPRWASSNASVPNYYLYEPANANTYADFLRALIARYGPNGSFWRANPSVPRLTIRRWQIWNEPAFNYFWASQPYYVKYPGLLRVAYRAVHRADRGAKVITAGLANTTINPSWKYLKLFYKHGFHGSFDILALHPFASTIDRVVRIIQFDRAVLASHRDGSKPIYLTEMSWPGSVGKIPPRDYLGFETTPARQAKLLGQAYTTLVRNRGLRVGAAFWYAWASAYQPVSVGGQAVSFQYAGLTRYDGLAGFASTPLLRSYSTVARRYR